MFKIIIFTLLSSRKNDESRTESMEKTSERADGDRMSASAVCCNKSLEILVRLYPILIKRIRSFYQQRDIQRGMKTIWIIGRNGPTRRIEERDVVSKSKDYVRSQEIRSNDGLKESWGIV